MTQDTELKQN